jgi:predicted transcriptional regulator of viral defense system
MPGKDSEAVTKDAISLQYLDKLRSAALGGYCTPSKLKDAGIGFEALRSLQAAGYIVREGRGLYHVAEAEITELTSLAALCARVPKAIVCLLSALEFHDIGTSLPHALWIAIAHKARPPKYEITDLRIVRFSQTAMTYGVIETSFEGVPGRITNPARTVLDCFRFERLVGRETAMEALRDGLGHRKFTVDALYRAMEFLPSRGLAAALEHM